MGKNAGDTLGASKHGSSESLAESRATFGQRRYGEIFGLFVALGLTTLFWWPSIASRLLPDSLVWRNVAAQAVDWLFCLVLMGIVLHWERRPLSSLGFKPLTSQNLAAGLGLGGFAMIGLVLWKFAVVPLLASRAGGRATQRPLKGSRRWRGETVPQQLGHAMRHHPG